MSKKISDVMQAYHDGLTTWSETYNRILGLVIGTTTQAECSLVLEALQRMRREYRIMNEMLQA